MKTMKQQVIEVTRKALELMLNLDHSVLQTLYEQWKHSSVKKVELTGVGFYVYFDIPDDVQKIDDLSQFTIQGVAARMNGLKEGAGFVLFVSQGKLDMLECFTYEEPWPASIENLTVSYIDTSEAIIKEVSSN